ncbi:MAG TPA: IS256 family transposase [Acidimicrobiales bacterium]|nr:IS256 family transposase [Acidimicrobiales bacterium]
MLRVLTDDDARAELADGLDEIVREGARRMLAVALEAEVDAYVAAFVDERDENGHRLVARNGRAEPRTITTAAGGIEIQAPRVNDRGVDGLTGERRRFVSVIVPPWCRKSPKVTEVLPLMYLHGMSSGDFAPALEEFFGSAAGLSPSVITRLTKQWQADQRAFAERRLDDRDFVYIWADGIHFNVRLEEARLCALVIVGVRADGTKELVAITDGHRESTESWADLLRDLKRRGMSAPMVAVGDGALGFWAALRTVWPGTTEQRCWVHKVANVLNALPKSVQPTAKRMLGEIRDGEDRSHAVKAIDAFAEEFAVKWPKAVAKIVDDAEPLLAFYDFPAEHWIHLKTTNPIESTFATVRLRTKVTKGPGSRAAGLAMAFKLIEAAEKRWRSVNAPHLVALVRAGVKFEKGVMIERPSKQDQEAAA